MKILHVNTHDSFGAAKACLRLHHALERLGVDSQVLVLRRYRDSPDVVPFSGPADLPSRALRFLRKKRYARRSARILRNKVPGFEQFSFPDAPFDVTGHDLYAQAHVVNLHWVADFVHAPTFFLPRKKPIVWTLHDMNPFTGGCHYAGSCTAFREACVRCPQLEGTRNPGIVDRFFRMKQAAFDGLGKDDLTIVTLSRWLHDAVRSSRLLSRFPQRLIPNGLNAAEFTSVDRGACRQLLGLPPGRKLLLFVGDNLENRRKGFSLFKAAFDQVREQRDVAACIVGRRGTLDVGSDAVFPLGVIADDRLMNAAYAAADVYVISSVEDNLPNTVVEALMSGTPVIGFPVGGMLDMIQPGRNGLLCADVSARALADAIETFFHSAESFDRAAIRDAAVGQFSDVLQATRYRDLYNELVTTAG